MKNYTKLKEFLKRNRFMQGKNEKMYILAELQVLKDDQGI